MTYSNPILAADWSDPDVVRVGDEFVMVASSFHRVPGLPVLTSRDLVHWRIVGHALPRLWPEFDLPRHGCGVWAPAIRYAHGMLWIFFPDPDRGIFAVTATDPAGPWSEPLPVKLGKGLIDPCPLWDDDGNAYLAHAWAKSRAGFNNIITLHRMAPDASALLDDGRTVIDGAALPGYRTIEGPKLYRHAGYYWIFAPAGGVAFGWQSVFRAKDPFGPYEERIVLAQNNTTVNGPHQGAWVETASGEHWFLHFQDREAFGRVVHLQPVRWEDDWPVIGEPPGSPVSSWPSPALPADDGAPATSDPFTGPTLGLQWTWAGNPSPSWSSFVAGGLKLTCVPGIEDLTRVSNVLGQRLPVGPVRASVSLRLFSETAGARAGLTVLGQTFAWIGLEHRESGTHLVFRSPDSTVSEPWPDEARLTVSVDATGRCEFGAGPVGGTFTATPGLWVGATLGLFATGDSGHAVVSDFTVEPHG